VRQGDCFRFVQVQKGVKNVKIAKKLTKIAKKLKKFVSILLK
jgi:hypothetical protein